MRGDDGLDDGHVLDAGRPRGPRGRGERGIIVLLDILTNAGGVTISYSEWVQDLGRLFGVARRSARSWPTSSTTASTGFGSSRTRRIEDALSANRRIRHRRPELGRAEGEPKSSTVRRRESHEA